VYIEGGYKTVTPVQIANCFAALNEDAISYRAVRVFFACLAVVAVREAAKRDSRRKGRRPRTGVRYRISELCVVTGLKNHEVNRELKGLQKAGLLSWREDEIKTNTNPIPGSETLLESLSGKRSPFRPVPIPRALLRFVASSARASVGKTAVAYAMRGLSIDRHGAGVRSTGAVKASWIASTFGLSLRSAKSARKALIDCELITKDTGSFQRKLNRDGAFFRLNCNWTGQRKFAPLGAKSRVIFAPPYKYKKTSYEFKNQKSQSASALKPSGVCKANPERKPNLRDIQRGDLKTVAKVGELFRQGVAAGWARGSEAEFLNWTAAAIRANTARVRDPVRVFVTIIRNKRWHLITQAHEDRARAAIRHHRERNVPRFSKNDCGD